MKDESVGNAIICNLCGVVEDAVGAVEGVVSDAVQIVVDDVIDNAGHEAVYDIVWDTVGNFLKPTEEVT